MYDQPINVIDRKGKTVAATGKADIFPMLLGLDEDYRSYQVMSGSLAGSFQFGPKVDPFMKRVADTLGELTKTYVKTAQIGLAEALGIDAKQLEDDGADGFQLNPEDPRINAEVIEKTNVFIEERYPTGPLTPMVMTAMNRVADDTLQEAWDKGDNYKVFVGYLIANALNQFAMRCQQIVNQQVLGPITQILEYRDYIRQANAAQSGLTDAAGNPLSSKEDPAKKIIVN